MANLEQLPGELNLSFVAGDDFTFTASFVGDLSAYTHAAYIYDGSRLMATFTVTDSFSTPNTVVSFALTDTQTIGATSTPYNWFYTQTNGEDTRTILAGTVSVVAR